MKSVLFLLLITGFVWGKAPFLRAELGSGGYFAEGAQSSSDKAFFQYRTLRLQAGKGTSGAKISYRYSDIYDRRPSTTQNFHRLDQASIYHKVTPELRLEAGRTWRSLLDGPLYLDGAAADLSLFGKTLDLSLFAGMKVPTVYEADFVRTKSDSLAGGLQARYRPIKNWSILSEFHKNNAEADGKIGFGTQYSLQKRVHLSTSGVFSLDSANIQKSKVSVRSRLRKRDYVMASWEFREEKTDTTSYYEYLLRSRHQLLQTGYMLALPAGMRLGLDYGLLLEEGFTGQLFGMSLSAWGATLSARQEYEKQTRATDLKLSWGATPYKWLRFETAGGVLLYDLKSFKSKDLAAWSASVGPTFRLPGGLDLKTRYSFLSNRFTTKDHRVFLGLLYHFSKKFGR